MTINELAELIIKSAAGSSRFIVAIAGPPASGKSTIAEKLSTTIAAKDKNSVPNIVPMDGFHLDNKILDDLNLRERKGASQTFDADGFIALIEKIYSEDENIKIPEFNRTKDKVVDNGKMITGENKIVIVEGNYLFLEEAPWNVLMGFFDLPIFILPKTEILEKRLIDRWLEQGFSLENAKTKAYSNDIPNAKSVLANSAYVDHTYEEISS
ncbi:MAG: nucleoside/nucleotide kinase family protein [Rhizobiales bacterium]|nr:nucleoside/nucleotide kinase family protein [Hyphomicrobiales bacterium]